MASKHTAIKVEGINELLRDLNKMPKEVNAQVRKGSYAIASELAGQLHGWGGTAQAAPLLDRVRARNDRVPNISLGGEARAGVSGGARVGDLMGANFGSHAFPQFPPVKRPDYYVYALIQHRSSDIMRMWAEALGKRSEEHT